MEAKTDHNRQKKAAVINDFTSFGRCSLAVSIPVLSAMGVQCCPVPTAFFTNHTGFKSYSWLDNTSRLDDYIREWKLLGLEFNAIQTGFLGSPEQVEFVYRFLEAFRRPGTIVAVDPVMGDYGKLYATYDRRLADAMRGFLGVADILTPNLTEACILAGWEFRMDFTNAELERLCLELAKRRARKVVVSGVPRGEKLVNAVWSADGGAEFVEEMKIGGDRSGTGDVFSSVILADAVNGVDFAQSVRKASRYTARTVEVSAAMGLPDTDGLAIEETLKELCK